MSANDFGSEFLGTEEVPICGGYIGLYYFMKYAKYMYSDPCEPANPADCPPDCDCPT